MPASMHTGRAWRRVMPAALIAAAGLGLTGPAQAVTHTTTTVVTAYVADFGSDTVTPVSVRTAGHCGLSRPTASSTGSAPPRARWPRRSASAAP
jgi:hypothetical protein